MILGTYLTQDHSLHLLCGRSVDDQPYVINMVDFKLIKCCMAMSHLEFKQKKREKNVNDSSLRINSPVSKQFITGFICGTELRRFSRCSEFTWILCFLVMINLEGQYWPLIITFVIQTTCYILIAHSGTFVTHGKGFPLEMLQHNYIIVLSIYIHGSLLLATFTNYDRPHQCQIWPNLQGRTRPMNLSTIARKHVYISAISV